MILLPQVQPFPLFDLSFLTALRPSERSLASAFSATTSFSSSGVLISPRFSRTFLVRGLSVIATIISAFFSGVSGRFFLARPTARFLAILFGNGVEHPAHFDLSVFFLYRLLLSLAILLSFSSFSFISEAIFCWFRSRRFFFATSLIGAFFFLRHRPRPLFAS